MKSKVNCLRWNPSLRNSHSWPANSVANLFLDYWYQYQSYLESQWEWKPCKTDSYWVSIMPERWVRCPVCGHERTTFAKRPKCKRTLHQGTNDPEPRMIEIPKPDVIAPKKEPKYLRDRKKWRNGKYWYYQHIDIVVYARLFVAG